jgi:hypothetical protein
VGAACGWPSSRGRESRDGAVAVAVAREAAEFAVPASPKCGVVALRESQNREAEKHPGSVVSITAMWVPLAQ